MTRTETPFVTLKKLKEGEVLESTDRFEGFCVDLLEHIADLVGFNYVIELVDDNNYGALDLETGEWNGLVKGDSFFRRYRHLLSFHLSLSALMDGEADLAIGAMTINFAREAVIDFTSKRL